MQQISVQVLEELTVTARSREKQWPFRGFVLQPPCFFPFGGLITRRYLLLKETCTVAGVIRFLVFLEVFLDASDRNDAACVSCFQIVLTVNVVKAIPVHEQKRYLL